MRNFIALLLLVLFTFGCAKSSGMFTQDETSTPDTNQVVSQEFDIAQVTADTIGGKIVQIVHLKDGKEMIFSDEYMGINDLDLRINYMTYKNLQEYQLLKDTLQKQLPKVSSDIIDLLYFNHFLEQQGLKIITYEEYDNAIADKINNSNIQNTSRLIWMSAIIYILLIAAMLLVLNRMYNKFSSFLADDSKYLYIGKKTSP